MRFLTHLALPLIAALALSACGLRPMYVGGGSGSVALALSQVEVPPIEGKAGWLVRHAIQDRIEAVPDGQPSYRLKIVLDDSIGGFGVRADYAITRERRTLRARYQLVDIATGAQMLDASVSSDAGILTTSCIKVIKTASRLPAASSASRRSISSSG